MNQLKLSDMYTCYFLKLYYKLYRNRLPPYLKKFIPVYGDSRHNLQNRCIHLPDIRCEFGKINAKCQMHVILRELATPGDPPKYLNSTALILVIISLEYLHIKIMVYFIE